MSRIIGIFGIYDNTNRIHRIIKETTEFACDFKHSNEQNRIAKAAHILYDMSCVTKEEINSLSKEQASKFQDAVEYVWAKLRETGCSVVNYNITLIQERIKQEEDLSKLSKEELIKRLQEAMSKK